MTNLFDKIYIRSLANPEGFWAEAAKDVHWYKKWDKVLDDSQRPFYQWFKGGLVNSCYNALDLHVTNGRADQLALVYDSPLTDTIKTFTYRELLDQVARFAGVLASQGIQKGDRVIIYMPMVPEAVIAMLGYEFIRFSARHVNHPLMRVVITPNLALQSLTTRPPDDSMIEVAIAALRRVLEIEGSLTAD